MIGTDSLYNSKKCFPESIIQNNPYFGRLTTTEALQVSLGDNFHIELEFGMLVVGERKNGVSEKERTPIKNLTTLGLEPSRNWSEARAFTPTPFLGHVPP